MLDWEKIIENQNKENIWWNLEEYRINYRDIIMAGLFWINVDNPWKLVEDLINYKKNH